MHTGLLEIIAITVHMEPLDSLLWSGVMNSYFTSWGAQECTCVALACSTPAGLACECTSSPARGWSASWLEQLEVVFWALQVPCSVLSGRQLHMQGKFGDLFWTEIQVKGNGRSWSVYVTSPFFVCPLKRKGEKLLKFRANKVHVSDWNLQTGLWCMSPTQEHTFLSVPETTKCCSCSFTPTSSVSAKMFPSSVALFSMLSTY